ncbi:MAG: hypothetical protein FD123_394 [Bacteroidetes bacterium]|nr:MAG: hypothetical protein FD123_394 [Bacteroidota bacterium]
MIRALLLFLLSLLFACTSSREARIKNERIDHGKYLKTKITVLSQNDSCVNVSLRIKNKAKYITYQSIEIEAYHIGTAGDTLELSGHANLCDLAPRKRVMLQTYFMRKGKKTVKAMRAITIAGTPRLK